MRYWTTYILWQLSIMGYVWLSGRVAGIIK